MGKGVWGESKFPPLLSLGISEKDKKLTYCGSDTYISYSAPNLPLDPQSGTKPTGKQHQTYHKGLNQALKAAPNLPVNGTKPTTF
jgi:hypothetical protein